MPKAAAPKKVGFLRLENTQGRHNKFYEMTMFVHPDRPYNSSCDVYIRYGRIGTNGKYQPLKGTPLGLPKCGADKIDPDLGKRAFLKQLKKKFRDKSYALDDLRVDDDWLHDAILDLREDFESDAEYEHGGTTSGANLFDEVADMLEDRSF